MPLKTWTGGEKPLAIDVNNNFNKVLGQLIDLTAGESLTAGKPGYIFPNDNKLYTAHGFKETASATSWTHPSTPLRQISKLSDTQYIVLSNSGATLTVSVYAKSAPNTLVANATVATNFDNASGHSDEERPAATVCRLSNTTFVVFWRNTTSGNLRFRTGSISGGTITMDTDTAYPGTPDQCYGLTAVPGDADGKVIFSYFDAGAVPGTNTTVVSNLSYLTVVSNSVTVTVNVNFSRPSGTFAPEGIWTHCGYSKGICYGLFGIKDNGGNVGIKYSIIDLSDNSTVSDIDTIIMESPAGSGISASYASTRPFFVVHDGKGYYTYRTSLNISGPYVGVASIFELSLSGCRIVQTFNTVKGNTDPGVGTLPMVGNECGVIVFDILNDSVVRESEIYIQRGSVLGFGLTLKGVDFPPEFKNSWYSNTRDEVVIFNSNNVKTWALPTPFDGYIEATVSSGAAAELRTANIVTLSGLVANRDYFLKDSYTTIGDISTKGTIKSGRAISTSSMLLLK